MSSYPTIITEHSMDQYRLTSHLLRHEAELLDTIVQAHEAAGTARVYMNTETGAFYVAATDRRENAGAVCLYTVNARMFTPEVERELIHEDRYAPEGFVTRALVAIAGAYRYEHLQYQDAR